MEDFFVIAVQYQGSGGPPGHPPGPLNGPCEADFSGPLLKKGAPGSFHGPNWSFFHIDLPTIYKVKFKV